MRLLSLQEAAKALGYTVKGLRKIVDRSRSKANGTRTRGATIRFLQAEKGSPIKFKEEWIEEFVERYTVDPNVTRNGKPRKKREKQEAAFGFDETLA